MTDNNQEYQSLCSQKRAKQTQYRNYQSKNNDIDEKLRKLKSVKSTVKDLKADFKTHKKSTISILKDDTSDWKGNTKTTFSDKGEDLQEAENSYYTDTLDYVLDSLNNEITRLENEKWNNLGIMGRLISQINSLANRIENFFN